MFWGFSSHPNFHPCVAFVIDLSFRGGGCDPIVAVGSGATNVIITIQIFSRRVNASVFFDWL